MSRKSNLQNGFLQTGNITIIDVKTTFKFLEKAKVINTTNIFSPFRWKINEKIVVTDVTINDQSTGNDHTVTMRESHNPEGFFGKQKSF